MFINKINYYYVNAIFILRRNSTGEENIALHTSKYFADNYQCGQLRKQFTMKLNFTHTHYLVFYSGYSLQISSESMHQQKTEMTNEGVISFQKKTDLCQWKCLNNFYHNNLIVGIAVTGPCDSTNFIVFEIG